MLRPVRLRLVILTLTVNFVLIVKFTLIENMVKGVL